MKHIPLEEDPEELNWWFWLDEGTAKWFILLALTNGDEGNEAVINWCEAEFVVVVGGGGGGAGTAVAIGLKDDVYIRIKLYFQIESNINKFNNYCNWIKPK